ncbi:restriction endonuclease subunit S [Echinicola salinicaeni]|uniref:restriction endonuclease subunit S n=1 Tax=Echinicola salinicaeni TaxID=2762757 RepID=UPI00164425E7|nr:restriction endonuclease subunit S [Echinicola salinicaeni]
MERYPAYKETGIEWIGEIPNDWTIKKIKHKCSVKARVGWKGLKSDEFLIKGYSYLVTGSDFKRDTVVWKDCYQIDQERYEEDPYIQLQEEDLLITKDGTIGKLAIVKNLDKPACLNSGIFVVRPTEDDFTTKYLFWLLKSKAFTQFNDYTSYGSTIQHLYQNVFVEFWFPFPTLEVQTQIANYLETKTAEIDNIIAAKKKLIALYEEEKAAIINQAVTKGINPDVKLKPSGVEWLGDIPEHWEVKRLKFVSYFQRGHDLSSSNFINGDIPIYGSNGIIGYHNTFTSKGPSITVGRSGSVGEVNFVKEDFYWAHNTSLFLLENYGNNVEYLFHLLKCLDLKSYSAGSAVGSLNRNKIHEIKVAVPPKGEQDSILDEIKNELGRVNSKMTKAQKLIELLTEYRTTLISEVVTGKIKVTA